MLPRLDTIRQTRQKLGITQKKLAGMCGVSTSMINQIESGRCKPSYDTAKRIFDNLASLEVKALSQKAGSLCSVDIVKMGEEETLHDAVQMMRRHSISQIPIFDAKGPVGVVTEDGIVKHLASGSEGDLKETRLRDMMEPIPPIVDFDTPAGLLVPLIRYSKCILVSKESKITGIITASDTLKIMG